MLNRYITHSGYIDVRRLAITKRRMMARVEVPEDALRELNRNFALYLVGSLLLTAAILYWGM